MKTFLAMQEVFNRGQKMRTLVESISIWCDENGIDNEVVRTAAKIAAPIYIVVIGLSLLTI